MLPPRRSIALVLAALAVTTPSVAIAQDSANQPTDEERKALGEALLNAVGAGGAGGAGTTPGATTPGIPGGIPGVGAGGTALPSAATPTEPGAAPTDGTGAPAPAAGVAAGLTPGPPAYLVPGPGAAQQPVSSVTGLTEAAVPAEPLRIGALLAALLAFLAVAAAVLLRALGLRTPVAGPVAAPAHGPAARLGERVRGTADDMRDFLRRSR